MMPARIITDTKQQSAKTKLYIYLMWKQYLSIGYISTEIIGLKGPLEKK